MEDLKAFRKKWSEDHKILRSLLKSGAQFEESRRLFYAQHEVLHSKNMSGSELWSYSDKVFDGLAEQHYRVIPPGTEHSLIWILWHISRIEDITLNILIAEGEQIYLQNNWKNRLGSPIHYAGNQITQADLGRLNKAINLADLLEYRIEVGKQTRSIVARIKTERLADQVDPAALDRLVREGAVLAESVDLLSYWGNRKIYQLLLMPPTRHIMVHMNEAFELKKKIQNMSI